MAGLPRSDMSFRRQGSSGLVWDDSFLSGELNKVNKEQRGEHSKELPTINTVRDGGYRTGKVSPALDPPSPKLSGCGFCGAFGKKKGGKGQRSKPGKRQSK